MRRHPSGALIHMGVVLVTCLYIRGTYSRVHTHKHGSKWLANTRLGGMKRSVWSAPAVERAATTLLASLPATYRPVVDFQLLTRESGSVRHDLPIWVSTPNVIQWSADARHHRSQPSPLPSPLPVTAVAAVGSRLPLLPRPGRRATAPSRSSTCQAFRAPSY
jgi:hypothetical protein